MHSLPYYTTLHRRQLEVQFETHSRDPENRVPRRFNSSSGLGTPNYRKTNPQHFSRVSSEPISFLPSVPRLRSSPVPHRSDLTRVQVTARSRKAARTAFDKLRAFFVRHPPPPPPPPSRPPDFRSLQRRFVYPGTATLDFLFMERRACAGRAVDKEIWDALETSSLPRFSRGRAAPPCLLTSDPED